MTDELRTTLHRLADDAAAPQPVPGDLWRRGRAARRRGQAFAVAAALALVVSVGGAATLLAGPDPETRTASTDEVPEGAIPSRIVDPADPVSGDLGPGRASVAFVGSGQKAIVVTAADGRYHALPLESWDGDLLSLSPDGRRLAWTYTDETGPDPMSGLGVLDLETGEDQLYRTGSPLGPTQVSWAPGSQWAVLVKDRVAWRIPMGANQLKATARDEPIDWVAIDDDGVVTLLADGAWVWEPGRRKPRAIDLDLHWGPDISGRGDHAVASPTGNTIALSTKDTQPDVDFVSSGRYEERPLATDLYPDGAAVRPLGWATDTLVLAQVDAPAGSDVEGPHLALLTAPNTPERQWTYRVVVRDVPDTDTLTMAVDLLPDPDGTSSQELTHDFPVPPEGDISWMIGLGVAAAIAVLMALRWLWRRFWLWRRPLG